MSTNTANRSKSAVGPKPTIAAEPFAAPELVGVAYRDFTPAQHQANLLYRRRFARCETCGGERHHWTECNRRKKQLTFRQKHHLCLQYAPADHKLEDCPIRNAIEKKLGPRAERGEVPRDMVGCPYKLMDARDKKEIQAWRSKKNLCAYCGKREHTVWDCIYREAQIQKQYRRKLETIRSGEKILNLTFSGDLAKLPVELRVSIWTLVARAGKDVVVRQGYMSLVLCSLRAGIPLGEIIQGWLQGSTFRLSETGSMEQFKRMLTGYDGYPIISSLSFGEWVSQSQFSIHEDLRDEYVSLAQVCPNLRHVKIPIPNAISITTNKQTLNSGSDPHFDVTGFAVLFSLQELAKIPTLRAVLLEGYTARFSASYHHEGTEDKVRWVAEHLSALSIAVGREDIFVDFDCSCVQDR